MTGAERILIAAAHGRIAGPFLSREFPHAELHIAENKTAVQRAIRDRMRFDIVVSDLFWGDALTECSFDGLDVLQILRASRKTGPVVFAAIGIQAERDHLDEAVEQDETAGVCLQSAGPPGLSRAIGAVLAGARLPADRNPVHASPPNVARIHAYFRVGKGRTAARMAGAIASGRAVDHASLARAAAVGNGTANRLVDYLGPLITSRGEHGPGARMTPEVVYRWCGEHSRYILSWCRRNGCYDLSARVAHR